MAQTVTARASGKSKADFSLAASLMNTSSGTFRTITSISRRCGAWSNCGGAVYSNTVQHQDKLIDTSTGKIIKTSNAVNATCTGSGPSSANYATCTFSNFTQDESRAAIAAWKNGKLQIKRTLKLVKHDYKAGTPTFRSGYYSDSVTINGTNAAYDPVVTISEFQLSTEATLYANTGIGAPFSFSLSTSVADSAYWEGGTISKRLELNIENLSGGSAPVSGLPLVATQNGTAATTWSLTQANFSFTRANGGFSRGCRYRVTWTLKVGKDTSDLSESASASKIIEVAAVPMHFNRHGNGIGIGCYSSVTDDKAEGVLDVGWAIRGGLLYEEGEVKTGGRWIDGKPIYRLVKNITCNIPKNEHANNWNNFPFFDARPDDIVFSWVAWLDDTGSRSGGNKLPYHGSYSLDYYFSTSSNDIVIVRYNEADARTLKLRVLVEYTKRDATSDAPLPGPEIMYNIAYPDEGVARADYIAMMAGIEIPADGEEVQADPPPGEGPGIDGEPAASENYEKVACYYEYDCWNGKMVKNAVGRWLTAEEAEKILATQKEGE